MPLGLWTYVGEEVHHGDDTDKAQSTEGGAGWLHKGRVVDHVVDDGSEDQAVDGVEDELQADIGQEVGAWWVGSYEW